MRRAYFAAIAKLRKIANECGMNLGKRTILLGLQQRLGRRANVISTKASIVHWKCSSSCIDKVSAQFVVSVEVTKVHPSLEDYSHEPLRTLCPRTNTAAFKMQIMLDYRSMQADMA